MGIGTWGIKPLVYIRRYVRKRKMYCSRCASIGKETPVRIKMYTIYMENCTDNTCKKFTGPLGKCSEHYTYYGWEVPVSREENLDIQNQHFNYKMKYLEDFYE